MSIDAEKSTGKIQHPFIKNRAASNQTASAYQRKQLPELRDSPRVVRKSLPATHQIKD
jgi:hypothetical protein